MTFPRDFTLAELTKSDIALRMGIENTPGPEEIANLERVAEFVLQPVRDNYGWPLVVRSGYRSPKVNSLCGSKPTSQHLRGQAVDFEVSGVANASVARWIKDNLDFDQLILEFWNPEDPHAGWVHCSYVGEGNRKQVLAIHSGGTMIGLPTEPR